MADRSSADDVDEFPERAPAVPQYEFLLRYAAHAAVRLVGSTQIPTVAPEGITFTLLCAADGPAQAEQVRATLIAIGAALAALRIAMRHFGHTANITLFPDTNHPEVVAKASLGEPQATTLGDRLRFNALMAPNTRNPIDETRPLPPGLIRALPHLVARPGMWATAVAAASDRMRVRDYLRDGATPRRSINGVDAMYAASHDLLGPLDAVTSGLFLLGAEDYMPLSSVTVGEAVQELIVLLRMQDIKARVMFLSDALGQQIREALSLPQRPQLIISAAYGAARR